MEERGKRRSCAVSDYILIDQPAGRRSRLLLWCNEYFAKSLSLPKCVGCHLDSPILSVGKNELAVVFHAGMLVPRRPGSRLAFLAAIEYSAALATSLERFCSIAPTNAAMKANVLGRLFDMRAASLQPPA